jgi:hypothetical protein
MFMFTHTHTHTHTGLEALVRRFIGNFLPHFQRASSWRRVSQWSAPCRSGLSPLDLRIVSLEPEAGGDVIVHGILFNLGLICPRRVCADGGVCSRLFSHVEPLIAFCCRLPINVPAALPPTPCLQALRVFLFGKKKIKKEFKKIVH